MPLPERMGFLQGLKPIGRQMRMVGAKAPTSGALTNILKPEAIQNSHPVNRRVRHPRRKETQEHSQEWLCHKLFGDAEEGHVWIDEEFVRLSG
jgi:hypothetical protein